MTRSKDFTGFCTVAGYRVYAKDGYVQYGVFSDGARFGFYAACGRYHQYVRCFGLTPAALRGRLKRGTVCAAG